MSAGPFAKILAEAGDPATSTEALRLIYNRALVNNWENVLEQLAGNPNLPWDVYRQLLASANHTTAALDNIALPLLLLDDPAFWQRFDSSELNRIWRAAPSAFTALLGPFEKLSFSRYRKKVRFPREFPRSVKVYRSGVAKGVFDYGSSFSQSLGELEAELQVDGLLDGSLRAVAD